MTSDALFIVALVMAAVLAAVVIFLLARRNLAHEKPAVPPSSVDDYGTTFSDDARCAWLTTTARNGLCEWCGHRWDDYQRPDGCKNIKRVKLVYVTRA